MASDKHAAFNADNMASGRRTPTFNAEHLDYVRLLKDNPTTENLTKKFSENKKHKTV